MKYEKPMFNIMKLETEDVITLSINNDYDPEIKTDNGQTNPWN